MRTCIGLGAFVDHRLKAILGLVLDTCSKDCESSPQSGFSSSSSSSSSSLSELSEKESACRRFFDSHSLAFLSPCFATALEIRRVDNSFPDCATRARAIGHGSLHMGDDHQAHLADTGRSWVSWGVSQYWGLGRHNVLLLGNGLRSCGERLLRASTSVPTSSVERGGDKSGWGIPVFCYRLVSHLLRKFSMADAPLCTMTRRHAAYVYIGSPSLIGDCIPTQVQDTNQIW